MMNFASWLESNIPDPEFKSRADELRWKLQVASEDIEYLSGLYERWIKAARQRKLSPYEAVRRASRKEETELAKVIVGYNQHQRTLAKNLALKRLGLPEDWSNLD